MNIHLFRELPYPSKTLDFLQNNIVIYIVLQEVY